MNMKKIYQFTLISLAALSLTACLKDQADVFEEPSSARLENYLESVRTTLSDSQYGWVMSYYPGSAYATCYIGLEFGPQQVKAYSQADPSTGVTSSYKFTKDDGAVLSFDTYNSVLHYFATSDSQHYQARGGDFEFDIMDVTPDRIKLRGKRSRNYCYLDKLNEPIKGYLERMNEAEQALDIVSFEGEISGGLVQGYLDASSHTLSIGRKGAESAEMVSVRYMVVPGGIHINEPFTFQGVQFADFSYDAVAETFTGSGIVFAKSYPEGYVAYEDLLGKWTFYYRDGASSFPVELVAKDQGASFTIKGLSTFFDPEIAYNAGRGYMTWNTQAIGSAGALTIMLCAWDSNAGYLTWNTGAGMEAHCVDNTVEDFVFEWVDNGEWGTYVCNSWLIWSLSGESSAGAYSDWTFASGSYQLAGNLSMKKIVEE